MITIIIKIFGYYLLFYLSMKLRYSLIKTSKKEGKEKTNYLITYALIYTPSFIFVIYQLFGLGLRL